MRVWRVYLIAVVAVGAAPVLVAQDTVGVALVNDSVTIRFVDADLRAVVQTLGGYLIKPVLTANIPGTRVSFETPEPVERSLIPTLLRGLVESQGLQYLEDSTFVRIMPGPTGRGEARADRGKDQQDQIPILLHVVRLKHARAADVAATINILFGGAGEFSGSGGLPPTLSDDLRRNRMPRLNDRPPEISLEGAVEPVSTLQAPSVVVPDALTNSLLIRASEEDFAVLSEAIEYLDIRPLQVLIEVLIVEARSDDSFSLTASLFVPPQPLGVGGTVGGGFSGSGVGDLVIELLKVGKYQIDAVIRAQQSKGNVKIMSRPVLVTTNNTEASFLVGTQQPFVQVSRSLPTDAPTRDQVVQYRDVGTKLTIRPTINQDGYVSLVVQQEINQATGEVQFDAPVIATREASTQVLIRDGQTIVLGGIKEKQQEKVQSGVPILSSIPIIGGLFGSAQRRTRETELFIFLTPRILATDDDVDRVTLPKIPEAEADRLEEATRVGAEAPGRLAPGRDMVQRGDTIPVRNEP